MVEGKARRGFPMMPSGPTKEGRVYDVTGAFTLSHSIFFAMLFYIDNYRKK